MTFIRKESTVKAYQIEGDGRMRMNRGYVTLKKGDWIVTEEDGFVSLVPDEKFKKDYSPSTDKTLFAYSHSTLKEKMMLPIGILLLILIFPFLIMGILITGLELFWNYLKVLWREVHNG